MFSALFYSSGDSVTKIMGYIFVIIAVMYICSKLGGGSSPKSSYKPSRNYNSNRKMVYEDDSAYANWDDSWDDKWLHQGKYADHKHDDSTHEYYDYDPSWDDDFRK